MKQIKLVFENEQDGVVRKFGYVIDKSTGFYQTVEFDQACEVARVEDQKQIGNTADFGMKLARLIKIGLDDRNG